MTAPGSSAAYRIVRARPAHLGRLAAIERAAARQFPDDVLPAHLRDEVIPLAVHEDALRHGRLWVAVAGDGEEPVGFAVVVFVDSTPHLLEMDVLPAHARRGIGRRLVASIASWARAAGHRAITLTTYRHVAWNQPFYERLGFRPLSPGEVTPELGAILREEAQRGLDPGARVAMRMRIAP